MSINNIKTAGKYTNDILESRRTAFYNKLKAIAE